MTSTDVAVRAEHAPARVQLSADQLKYIAQTEFVPKAMRGNLPAIMACVAYGRELGLGDMVALKNVNVIDGRTELSAELMVSLVRQRGHSIQGELSGDSCTVHGRRIDNDDEITVTWTKEMAKEAGLINKDNWRKYSVAMLWARAVSQLCRALFADCFAGNTYTPGEVPSDAEAFAVDDGPEELVGDPTADQTGDDPSPTVSADAGTLGAGEQPSPANDRDWRKQADYLVGTLRKAGHLTTEQLYAAVGREVVLGDDGEPHWSALRETLTDDEALALVRRLDKYAKNLPVTA